MDLELKSGGWQLAATLDYPQRGAELAGAVVLVHGSGPATRDAAYWLDLSSHLTTHGYACLRYDKPGCGDSGGDWRRQTFDDRASESLEALDALKRQLPDNTCVGLMGGSQGGWIVLIAAARSPTVDFVICYSASGVSPAEQEEYRLAHHLPAEGHTADETVEAIALLRSRLASNRSGVAAERIFKSEASARSKRWFALVGGTELEGLAFDLAIYDYDPRPALEAVRCPVLAIWGERDLFVPIERSLAIFRQSSHRARRTSDKFLVVPNVGHGLRGDGAGIAPAVIEETVQWLSRVSSRQPSR